MAAAAAASGPGFLARANAAALVGKAARAAPTLPRCMETPRSAAAATHTRTRAHAIITHVAYLGDQVARIIGRPGVYYQVAGPAAMFSLSSGGTAATHVDSRDETRFAFERADPPLINFGPTFSLWRARARAPNERSPNVSINRRLTGEELIGR